MKYSVNSYLHMKKSKLKNKKPCEDYSITYQDTYKTIAVIADGHGDPRCFRAHIGAKIACFTVIELLKNKNDFEDDSLEELSCLIKNEWYKKIEEHALIHPINQGKQDMKFVYGTTLSVVVLTTDKMILLNVGDGKCMVRYDDQSFVSLIKKKGISPDSLAYKDVKMDIYVSPLPRCLMLTSDGGSSFQNEEVFINKVEELYLVNREKFHRNMMNLVNYFSSDDDVSMIWIYQDKM